MYNIVAFTHVQYELKVRKSIMTEILLRVCKSRDRIYIVL